MSENEHLPTLGSVITNPQVDSVDNWRLAQQLYDARDKTVQQIADLFGVPRSTVYGHLDKSKTVRRQPKKSMITKPR